MERILKCRPLAAIAAAILLLVLAFGTGVSAFADEGYSFANAPASADIGETVNFTVMSGGQAIDSADLTWSVDPADSAIVKNGSVTFVSSGNVTVSAKNESGTAQAVVNVSRTPYTEDGLLCYNFTTALAMNRFDANFVPDNTGVGAGNEDWEEHWSLNTERGYVERINDFDPDVGNNVTALYFKNTKMDYFDVTVVYQSVTGAGGWLGVVSNNTDLTKRGIDNGLASFVQSDGKPTFWGPLVGSAVRELPYEGYGPTAWHVMRVRMVQGQVSMYIDDMQTPAYSYNLVAVPAEGNIGVMASGTGFRIKHIRASYLEADGTAIAYRAVDSLTVSEKPAAATVGQTIEVKPVISPAEATVQGYTMSSSNSNVCIAKNGKLVFIAEGTVTVSVVSDDNPALVEEWEIQVSGDSALGESGSGSYYVDGGAGGETNVAMILTIVFGALTVCGAVAIVMLLLVKKKR